MSNFVHNHVPSSIRQHPFGHMFFLLWATLGVSLVVDSDINAPWPDVLWPGDSLENLDLAGKFGYFWVAFSMILSGLLFLFMSSFVNRVKMAAFVRWTAIWIGVMTSGSMLIAIAVLALRHDPLAPYWWMSLFVWTLLTAGFLLGLRVANCEFRTHFALTKEGR